MRFLTRSLLAMFLAALAVGLLATAGIMVRETLSARSERANAPREARERVFTARVVAIEPGAIAPILGAFGEVQSRRTLELRAPLSSTIVGLADGFQEGAAVRQGQVLIRLDTADARAALALAENDTQRLEAEQRDAIRALELSRLDREESQAQADLRRRAFERRQSLTERGVGTEATVEEAELAYASARAAVIARRQAEAQAEARVAQAETALARQRISLAEAQRRLADTELVAQFDGVLSDTSAIVGAIVGTNERLARVIDPDALEVAFRLSTAQYLRLLGPDGGLTPTPVQVSMELGGVELISAARLTRSSPSVGEGQTGRLVYADIDAPRGFRPGDFVTVSITEPLLPGVAQIPASAVDALGEVLVLGADDRLETAIVEVVRRQGDSVLIRAPGLAGREVVAVRTPLLGEGIRVRAQRAEAAAIPEAPAMVSLDEETRARLIAQVEGATMMPDQVRTRILVQLSQDQVPARLLERLQQGSRGG